MQSYRIIWNIHALFLVLIHEILEDWDELLIHLQQHSFLSFKTNRSYEYESAWPLQ